MFSDFIDKYLAFTRVQDFADAKQYVKGSIYIAFAGKVFTHVLMK
jgi:hypothetical protein